MSCSGDSPAVRPGHDTITSERLQAVGSGARRLAGAAALQVVEAPDRDSRWQGKLDALRADGRTVPTRIVASQVKDDEGRAVIMMATIHDLTDLRRAQHEEQMRRACNETVVEHAGTLAVIAVPVDVAAVADEALRIVQPMLAMQRLSLVNATPAGFRDCLPKPLDLQRLMSVLADLAAQRQR